MLNTWLWWRSRSRCAVAPGTFRSSPGPTSSPLTRGQLPSQGSPPVPFNGLAALNIVATAGVPTVAAHHARTRPRGVAASIFLGTPSVPSPSMRFSSPAETPLPIQEIKPRNLWPYQVIFGTPLHLAPLASSGTPSA